MMVLNECVKYEVIYMKGIGVINEKDSLPLNINRASASSKALIILRIFELKTKLSRWAKRKCLIWLSQKKVFQMFDTKSCFICWRFIIDKWMITIIERDETSLAIILKFSKSTKIMFFTQKRRSHSASSAYNVKKRYEL